MPLLCKGRSARRLLGLRIYRGGCEIMTEAELEDHDRAPDVFHALKKIKLRNRLPMPFCRIGAVHGGNFSRCQRTCKSARKEKTLPSLMVQTSVLLRRMYPDSGPDVRFAGEIRRRMDFRSPAGADLSGKWGGGGRRARRLVGGASFIRHDFVSEVHLFENKGTPVGRGCSQRRKLILIASLLLS